jgi:hypothetical protein
MRGAGWAALGLLAAGAVIDRIAVTVGNTVITESEVRREVRLTQFLNRKPLDLGPQQRRAAAERLVDQQLIRNEMSHGTYPAASEAEAERMIEEIRGSYSTAAEYRAALAKYGITEAELKQHLLWEMAALEFTELRFPEAEAGQSANRAMPDGGIDGTGSADQRLDEWLKQARAAVRVVFQPGAFQ